MRKLNIIILLALTVSTSILLLADVDASSSTITCSFSSYTCEEERYEIKNNIIKVTDDFSITGKLFLKEATNKAHFEFDEFELGKVFGRVYNVTSGSANTDSKDIEIPFTGDKDDFTLDITINSLLKSLPTVSARVEVLLKFQDANYAESKIDYPAFGNLIFTYDVP